MKTIFSGLFALFLLAACSKQDSYEAEGTLQGGDPTLCGCCGDVVLTIDNQPGNYRVDSLPFMTRQQLYALNFPKRIKFNYEIKSTCGGINRLEITAFILKN
jgi:hypothetical protein